MLAVSISTVPIQRVQMCRKQEILLYIAPLALFDVIYPRRQLPEAPPSFARLVAEVFLSLFFYDLFFTIVHFVSHQVCRLLSLLRARVVAVKLALILPGYPSSVCSAITLLQIIPTMRTACCNALSGDGTHRTSVFSAVF